MAEKDTSDCRLCDFRTSDAARFEAHKKSHVEATEELSRLRIGRETLIAEIEHQLDDFNALKAERDALEAENERLTQERDLAVAHDRQPYPTAWAYERVCELNRALKVEVESLKALLRESPHDAGCHPSEGRHTERCQRVKAKLAAPSDKEVERASETKRAWRRNGL